MQLVVLLAIVVVVVLLLLMMMLLLMMLMGVVGHAVGRAVGQVPRSAMMNFGSGRRDAL